MLKQSISLLVFLLVAGTCFSQETNEEWFLDNYTKREAYIPMRDGVKLYTAIYTPKDTIGRHPILMERSPYSCNPYGPDKFMSVWGSYKMTYAKEKFIFVKQDVRGKYMSEGEFVEVRPFIKNKTGNQIDEASDTYDTTDWLINNIKNNNNKVGIIGVSYPGFYAGQGALSGHPSLVAASPQAPVTDWFIGDDWHHNGVFFMMDAQSFYGRHGIPRPIPATFETTGFSFKSDDNYDAFLKAGSLKNIAQLMGDSIQFWKDMYAHPNYDDWWQARNARNSFYDIKPAMLWVGGLFDAEDCFGAWASYKAAEEQSPETNSKLVMGPWYHGQWSHEGSFLGNVRFGSNTSKYYQDSIEAPFLMHHLLDNGGKINIAEATIFFTGENTWKKFDEWPPKSTENQSFYLQPNGKLVFNAQPNESLTLSDGLFDEYTSDPEHPVPYTQHIHFKRTREYLTDDQRFASRRPDVAHTFQKGHKIMVQIQSSWFPLADRNPQKFVDIYQANNSDFQKAEIRVYRDVENGSRIILPVLAGNE